MSKTKNQKGFHLIYAAVATVIMAVVVMAGLYVAKSGGGKSADKADKGLTRQQIQSLPDITYYQTHKSDNFIVDYSVIKWGNPYKGKNANTPHNGAHVHFQDAYKDWPQGGTAPSNYPPIYSPVEGYVDRVDYSMPTGDHDQYSIGIAFAKSDGKTWSFSYSFEPFIKEPSAGFYRKFINVKVGDHVKAGQVVAYMYLVKEADQLGAHIHFHISKEGDSGNTFPPAIFSKKVMDAYYARWGGSLDGFEGRGDLIPECMGYKLAADQNPFGTGAVDCLN